MLAEIGPGLIGVGVVCIVVMFIAGGVFIARMINGPKQRRQRKPRPRTLREEQNRRKP